MALPTTSLGGSAVDLPPASAGSSSSGTLTQGGALPNITTSQQQQTVAPTFYTDYLNQIATQGSDAVQGAKYVGATPLQQQSFGMAQNNVGNYQTPLQQATNLATGAGNTDVSQEVNNFMNPYTQQVVDQLDIQGKNAINQYLAPGATAGAVGSGQFGSERGAAVLGQAINTGLNNLNVEKSKALQTGYSQALTAAQQQQAAQLNAAQQLGGLASQTQQLGLGDVNALNTLGTQQQQIAQNAQLFPMQQLTNESALLRGYTIPSGTNSTYTGPIPGAYQSSPLQLASGLAAMLFGSGAGGSVASNLTDWISKQLGSGSTTGDTSPNLNAGGNTFAPTQGLPTSGLGQSSFQPLPVGDYGAPATDFTYYPSGTNSQTVY